MTQKQQEQLAQLEETIRQAKQQIEELKNPKPKKFEWKYNFDVDVYLVDIARNLKCNSFSYPDMIEYGRYRQTIIS